MSEQKIKAPLYFPMLKFIGSDDLVFYTHSDNKDRISDPHIRVVSVDLALPEKSIRIDFLQSVIVKIDVVPVPIGGKSAYKLQKEVSALSPPHFADFLRKIDETKVWIWFDGKPEQNSEDYRKYKNKSQSKHHSGKDAHNYILL